MSGGIQFLGSVIRAKRCSLPLQNPCQLTCFVFPQSLATSYVRLPIPGTIIPQSTELTARNRNPAKLNTSRHAMSSGAATLAVRAWGDEGVKGWIGNGFGWSWKASVALGMAVEGY